MHMKKEKENFEGWRSKSDNGCKGRLKKGTVRGER